MRYCEYLYKTLFRYEIKHFVVVKVIVLSNGEF